MFRTDVQRIKPEVGTCKQYLWFSIGNSNNMIVFVYIVSNAFIVSRFYSMSCLIHPVLHSSLHMHSLFCSGLKYTTRFVFAVALCLSGSAGWFVMKHFVYFVTIICQARAVSTDGLRPSFFTINGVVYAIQVISSFLSGWKFHVWFMRILTVLWVAIYYPKWLCLSKYFAGQCTITT